MRNFLRVVALILLLAFQARAQTTQLPSEPVPARESSALQNLSADDLVASLDSWCSRSGPDCGIPSRWTARIDIGDGVGYTRGFTYLEGFVPLHQFSECDVAFADARVVNFDEWDRWEFNAGGGYRRYLDKIDAVGGVNLFYDGRKTDANFFHQIGLGGEALFDRWEMRCNGYLIVGPHQQVASDFLGAGFVGNEFVVDRLRVFDVAMGGVDAEVGAFLPVLPDFAPRAFVGVYHYSAEHMHSATGIRGRVEAWLGDHCSIHLAIQHDDVFNTTVSGGLALHFGGRRERCCGDCRSVEERLGERVVRDPDVVISQRAELERAIFVPQDDPVILAASGSLITPGGDPTTPPAGPGSPAPPGTPVPPGTPPPTPGAPPPVYCLPFPGAPGDPATFPGNHFPPGFNHPCFPGLGRYKCLSVEVLYFRDDDKKKEKEKHGHDD